MRILLNFSLRKFHPSVFIPCLFMFCGGMETKAQHNIYEEVPIASPTAASIGKFVDIPVSYHTGLADVTIPIYHITQGNLELPINLRYHGGGIKVMEPSGWCGTGWSLMAGGVISRTVRGIPDEALNVAIGEYGHFLNFGFNHYFTEGGHISVDGGYPAPNDYDFAHGIYDGEPDLYFFNFGKYSGKFFFDDDRTPVLVDGEDLKIEYYFPMDTLTQYSLPLANIQGFKVTTPDGNKYYFGIYPGINSGVSAVEWTFPYSSSHQNISDHVFSSWYLTKVESYDNKFSIDFSYEEESYSYYTLSTFPVPLMATSFTAEYSLVKNFIEGVRLQKITYSNGSVEFNPDSAVRLDLGAGIYNGNIDADVQNNSATALKSINIKNDSGFCKKFNFFYDYFRDSISSLKGSLEFYQIETDRYRLRLDSISEESCDGGIKMSPYKFIYEGDFLPRRLSFAQDHWGFYNGEGSNNGLIPTYTTDTFNVRTGADRDSKWPEMSFGNLKKIIYPSGGFQKIEYEPNTTWVSTTRYNLVYKNIYGVGYDGSYTSSWNNVPFSNNYYRIVLVNDPCPNYPTDCGAGITITDSTNKVVFHAGVDGNERDTLYFALSAGNYNITMVRNDVGGNSGAQAYLSELVPVALNDNLMVGGLRVKAIYKNYNNSDFHVDSLNFNYDFNGKSSGVLYSRPTYVLTLKNDLVKQFGLAPEFNNTNYSSQSNGCIFFQPFPDLLVCFKSPSSIVPMSNTQGNHIGYNEVKVSLHGKGYSIFRYYGSNAWDYNYDDIAIRNINPTNCSPTSLSSPVPPPPYEYRRGKIKFEGYYDDYGRLLKGVQYYYDFDSTGITKGYLAKDFYVDTLLWRLGTIYDLRGFWLKSMEKITNEHDWDNDITMQVIDSTYFSSNFHHMPVKETQYLLNGDNFTTFSKYALDYRVSSLDSISGCLSEFDKACYSCDSLMNLQQYTSVDIRHKFLAYINNLICRANARNQYVTCREVNFLSPVSVYNNTLKFARSTADSVLKPILNLAFKYCNVPLEVSQWKNDKLVSSSFNQYRISSEDSMISYPSLLNKISLIAPADSFYNSRIWGNSIDIDSRYKLETQVNFKNGNISLLKPNSGIATSYLWGYSNSLPVAKVIDAESGDFAFTSFEGDQNGSWNLANDYGNTNGGITGNRSYTIDSGDITKMNINSAKVYYITYWTKNTVPFDLQGSLGAPVQINISGDWHCFLHKISGVSEIRVGGTGLIDELRLYPEGAHIETYTYLPLVGMTSIENDRNIITYYEYDELGRLTVVRDKDRNVLKKYCYNYAGQSGICSVLELPAWQPTGQSRCKPCPADSNYNIDVLQVEEMDMNPGSETYSQLRWRDTDSIGTCTISADWQNTTSALRCQTSSGNNTGYQEQEQIDRNPCSSTYNETRWITAGYDSTACPVPVVCSTGNCNIKGPDYKCVNGNCERGTKVITDAYYSSSQGGNICVYHYEWSDASWSANYSQFTGMFMCSPF